MQWLDPINFRLTNLAVMMKGNRLLPIESQDEVMMALNDCLCCLGDKTDITYDNCFPSQTRDNLFNPQELKLIKDVIQSIDFMNNGIKSPLNLHPYQHHSTRAQNEDLIFYLT